MRRRIRKAEIKYISLCPKGANRLPVLYKSDDQTVQFETLIKADMEKGEIVACVYAPEHRDSQGDIASAEVIKEAMYTFAKEGKGIDVRHDGKVLPKDAVFVAESFVIQKDDPRFADMKDSEGHLVDVTGGWGVVLKVEDLNLRQLYREGKWQGVSMAGPALVEAEKEDWSTIGATIATGLAKKLGIELNDDGELDMKPEELNKALTDQAKTIVEGVAKAVGDVLKALNPGEAKPAATPTTTTVEKKDGPPEFKGDHSKPEDVKKHEEALQQWELRKDVDWSKPESVAAYHAKLMELGKDKGTGSEEETDEVKELRKQKEDLEARLAKASKRSNQPAGSGGSGGGSDKDDKGVQTEGLSKEDEEGVKIGSEMAKFANGG